MRRWNSAPALAIVPDQHPARRAAAEAGASDGFEA